MRVFDLHTDTMMDVSNKVGKGETDVLGKHHMPDYKAGEVGGQIFALWVPPTVEDGAEYFTENLTGPQDIMMRMLARNFREFRDYHTVELAYTGTDIERIYDEGKSPVLLGIEGFYGFNGEPGMIDVDSDVKNEIAKDLCAFFNQESVMITEGEIRA